MIWLQGWWWTFGMAQLVGAMPSVQEDPCNELHAALREVPHVSLTRKTEAIEPIWIGEPPAVCEVAFQTTDSILVGAVAPDFLAEPGSATYGAGWRSIPEIVADGAGSGVHGIQRSGVRCVIRWEQPAYIDDDGTFVQSDTFSLQIQCSGASGRGPRRGGRG